MCSSFLFGRRSDIATIKLGRAQRFIRIDDSLVNDRHDVAATLAESIVVRFFGVRIIEAESIREGEVRENARVCSQGVSEG